MSVGAAVEALPPDVHAIYDEARRCMSVGAYNTAVMAPRKLLMHIAYERGSGEKQNFKQYVDWLVESHYVPPGGEGWAHHIRNNCNEANHEIELIDQHSAQRVLLFVEMSLRFVYEMPVRAGLVMPGRPGPGGQTRAPGRLDGVSAICRGGRGRLAGRPPALVEPGASPSSDTVPPVEETSGAESTEKYSLSKSMFSEQAGHAARPPGWPQLPTMPHFYEATVTDPAGHGAALRFLSLPLTADRAARHALGEPMPHEGDELGTDLIVGITPQLLIGGLLATRPDRSLFASPDNEAREISTYMTSISMDLVAMTNWTRRERPDLVRFVARAAVEPVVPVESSPLGATSLAALLGLTGTEAYLAQFGDDPLLLLTLPVGIVVAGGALGVGRALNAGLYVKVYTWITGEKPPPVGTDEPDEPGAPGTDLAA